MGSCNNVKTHPSPTVTLIHSWGLLTVPDAFYSSLQFEFTQTQKTHNNNHCCLTDRACCAALESNYVIVMSSTIGPQVCVCVCVCVHLSVCVYSIDGRFYKGKLGHSRESWLVIVRHSLVVYCLCWNMTWKQSKKCRAELLHINQSHCEKDPSSGQSISYWLLTNERQCKDPDRA